MADKMLLKLKGYKSPATVYPNKSVGKAAIVTTYYNKGLLYNLYHIRNPVDRHRYNYYRCLERLIVRLLQIDGRVWMTDDPPHWWAMLEHASHFSGHVLCAGLGLGLIVHALNDRPEVRRITVVEREQDVIDLVWPLVPHAKAEVVKAEWYNYYHPCRVDGIFNDLFVGNGLNLIGQAGAAMAHALSLCPQATVRVHGFHQPTLEQVALALIANGLSTLELARHASRF